jgi:serine/threonine-protein kinase
MKLVDAVSLREMLERCGPLSPEAALVVLKEALLELASSHRRGVVHRDCAPENVLIDTAGNSKLSDFGAAIAWDGQTAAGTPFYQAPEQWQGAPESPAADIYAAAVVFFECLTGAPPFSGDVFDLREQHIAEPVPLNLVPPPLRRLIAWGTAKDPADRPRSAITFVSRLESVAVAAYGPDWAQYGHRELAELSAAVLAGRDGGPGPAYPPDAASGGSKRRLALIAGVAAVAVVALGATATAVTLQGNGHRAASGLPNQESALTPTPASQTLTGPGTAPSGLATWAKTPSPGHTTSPAMGLTTSPAPADSPAGSGLAGSPTGSGSSATFGPRPSHGPSRPPRPGNPTASSSPTASSASPAPSESATASSPAEGLSAAGCGGQATFAATDSFSCPFTASGGLAPYNWSVTGLPDGLQTSDSGMSFTLETVQGDPVQRGTFTVTVTVQDSAAQPATATATMTLVITRAS